MALGSERQLVLELIKKVRSSKTEESQRAFEDLLDRYEPLIKASVSRIAEDSLARPFVDDLKQEATMVFFNAILTYDTEQTEVEFGLYAKICISNALISQLRSLKRRAAEPLTDTESNNLFVHESEDPSENILEQERVRALYAVIRKNLSSFEYRVWQYYMSGRTAREIGLLVGKDEKSISNAIYRIRKKLRAALQ
jgi:RNA polymerase sporulation-specific sigma factor